MNELRIQPSLVEVENLSVRFGRNAPHVVNDVSFSIRRGECLALVGESGSGKSVTSRTLVGLAGRRAEITADKLSYAGSDLRKFDERSWRALRGGQIGFVMQDALGSLDPLRTVGKEVGEPLLLHTTLNRRQREAKVIELLRAAGIPDPEVRAMQHPFQLSGGLRQRALIASAIACGPDLLLADEPTTALDATVQAQVLRLLESLRTERNAMLIVSHDLAVVARLADRVAVMRHGRIVEQGDVNEVFQNPQHEYTQSLLSAVTSVHSAPPVRLLVPFTGATPAVEASGVFKAFTGPDAKKRTAVSNISFSLPKGSTLGIVGESGSGKTTLIRMVLGLEKPDTGEVLINGLNWSRLPSARQRAEKRKLQAVFQDPLNSFDPRYTVERVIGEAVEAAGRFRADAKRTRAIELLELVRLNETFLGRRPIELSGGQRQRVAIARALAPRPDILVCDEPVSALDVSVQARIIDLLCELKERIGLSCLFISHDLGVISRVSDEVLVMKDGLAVEAGPVTEVFQNPRHPYTRALLDSIPRLEPYESLASA